MHIGVRWSHAAEGVSSPETGAPRNLAVGTLHAIYRQAARLVPSADLRRAFFLE